VIFNYDGKNFLTKKEIRCKDDVFTHLYTLIVNPDGTYEVLIDNEKAESGTLEEDWDFLPPKEIKDPEASKPEDWDDREKIDDPEDVKPEDWEKPEHIADPDATKVIITWYTLRLSKPIRNWLFFGFLCYKMISRRKIIFVTQPRFFNRGFLTNSTAFALLDKYLKKKIFFFS